MNSIIAVQLRNADAALPFTRRDSTRLTRMRASFRNWADSAHPAIAAPAMRFFIFIAAFFSRKRKRFFSSTISHHFSTTALVVRFFIFITARFSTTSSRAASSSSSRMASMAKIQLRNADAALAFTRRDSTRLMRFRACMRYSTESIHPARAALRWRAPHFLAARLTMRRMRSFSRTM